MTLCIHRIWLNEDAPCPPIYPVGSGLCAKLHGMGRFRQEFGPEVMDQLLRVWPGDWHLRYKAMSDLLRYRILYQEGGLYLDLDNRVVGDISPLLSHPVAVCALQARQSVSNSVLWAGAPHQLVWPKLEEKALQCLRTARPQDRACEVTGPHLFPDIVKELPYIHVVPIPFLAYAHRAQEGTVIRNRAGWARGLNGFPTTEEGWLDYGEFTLVVGMPSGGTSAVAGFLHHLGVSMGRRLRLADMDVTKRRDGGEGRRYDTYEDLEANRMCGMPLQGRDRSQTVDECVNTLVKYRAFRTAWQSQAGRCGLKWPWLTHFGGCSDRALEKLKAHFMFVAVTRPWEEVYESCKRRQPKNDFMGVWEPEEAFAGVGCNTRLYGEMWLPFQRLQDRWTPDLVVPYNDLRVRPEEWVPTVVEALRLHEPLPEQVERAVEFVRGYGGYRDVSTE